VIIACDIDAWAREVALAEAASIRDEVRAAVVAGGSGSRTLATVRRRLARLTPEQREIVVAAIGGRP
jgi:hypothetical protein